MKTQTLQWSEATGWAAKGDAVADAELVLFFAGSDALVAADKMQELHKRFTSATIVGCSTGGEIIDSDVLDNSIVASAIKFDDTKVNVATERIDDAAQSRSVGIKLGKALKQKDLQLVFVLSDGMRVNGSELVLGLRSVLGEGVSVSGGLAGDGARFGTTLVGVGDQIDTGRVVAIGFAGTKLNVGHGCVGGWEPFGPERMITKSIGNVLYEIDGQPALDLYKRYLGDEAANLPGSALLFPLCLRRTKSHDDDVVRTILSVNEADKTMTFAGDVPTGAVAQLMRGNISNLVSGATRAAEGAVKDVKSPTLALLVSCIGRKLLLGQRTSEEVEAVTDVLGAHCATIGFYSYGEISPQSTTGLCELHNQTMTITVLSET